jgi:hypothetical protein
LDERMHAVGGGNRGQAEIGNHHPLRRELYALIGAGIGNLWKRPGDGAAIGLCVYLVVMVLSILIGN